MNKIGYITHADLVECVLDLGRFSSTKLDDELITSLTNISGNYRIIYGYGPDTEERTADEFFSSVPPYKF